MLDCSVLEDVTGRLCFISCASYLGMLCESATFGWPAILITHQDMLFVTSREQFKFLGFLMEFLDNFQYRYLYGTNHTLLPDDIGTGNDKSEVQSHGWTGSDNVLCDGQEDTQ